MHGSLKECLTIYHSESEVSSDNEDCKTDANNN